MTHDDKSITYIVNFELEGALEYNICISRTKVVCKATNRDKRVFANYFYKNIELEFIVPKDYNLNFYKMGTIKEFEKMPEFINQNVKIHKWSYIANVI